jgi:ABC-type multidrug transport system fused ATPase/permease subunit
MSVDTAEIREFIKFSKHLFAIPIIFSIAIYMLWQMLSYMALNLLLVFLVLTPLVSYTTRKYDNLWKEQMEINDKRIGQLSEILNNIKLLKLFAWEKPFMERITKTREQEVEKLKKISYWSSAENVIWSSAPMIAAAVCFTFYTLFISNKLTAKTAFVSLYIFNLLRYSMGILPQVISLIVRFRVSINRLSKFLSTEELSTRKTSDLGSDNNIIEIENGDFAWDRNKESILKGINLKISKGSLVAIVGRVGSGKSSLFSAILGDMYQTRGTTTISGSFSYVPQTAWIQNTTLK